MRKIALNLAFLVLVFSFIFLLRDISCLAGVLFFIFFVLCFYLEIFSYKFAHKIAVNRGVFKSDSVLKKVFSGKIFIFFSSFYIAIFLGISFVFNLLSINKFEILFISLCAPLVFFLVKFVVSKRLKNELRYAKFVSKRWIILISSAVLSIIYGVLFFSIGEPNLSNLGYFEYLSLQNPAQYFRCQLLGEIYTYSFYLNSSFIWFKNALFDRYGLGILLLVIFNKFIFFIALNHLISLFFTSHKSEVRVGYFLKTIFTLAYITSVFVLLQQLNLNKESEEISLPTKSEKLVKIIIKSGIEFDIKPDELAKFRFDTNETMRLNLAKSEEETGAYIDAIYERAALGIAKQMSEWRYSAMTDYIVLWHSVIDENASQYASDKFSEFAKNSFDSDFEYRLSNLIERGVKRYKDELYKDVDKMAISSGTTFNLEQNLTAFFDKEYHLNRVKISGAGVATIGSVMVTKILAKTVSKTVAKTGAKVATSGTAALSGTVCGPAAVVCVPAFAVLSWFGVDIAVAKGDELLTKESFEKEIYDEIMKSKIIFKDELNLELEALYSEILSSFYDVE